MSRYSTGKSSSLLKDNSWIIKKPDEDDEDIDRDPNYGKAILSQYKTSETGNGSETEDYKTTTPVRTSTTSVKALMNKFGGTSVDDPQSSTLSSTRTSSYKSTTTTTNVTKNGATETTVTTTQNPRSPLNVPSTPTFTERVRSSSQGQQYTSFSPTRSSRVTETNVTTNKDAEDHLYDTLIPSSITGDLSTNDSKRTITTTEIVTVKSSLSEDQIDSSYSTKGAGDKLYNTLYSSSTKSDSYPSDRSISTTETVTVRSSIDDEPKDSSYSTSRTSKVIETSITGDKDAEDKLYDILIPSAIKDDVSTTSYSPTRSTRVTETTYTSNKDDSPKTTTYTRTSSGAEDSLYGTLLPRSISSDVFSPVSSSSSFRTREIVTVESSRGVESSPLSSPSSTLRTSSYEYSSLSSPTLQSSYRSSRSDEVVADTNYSKSSMKNVFGSSDRTVLEKDLCTSCRKPFNDDAKMILEDMRIRCHASCFKCEVCNSTLGHMKAGDYIWLYHNMVHCENCFEVTKDKWRR